MQDIVIQEKRLVDRLEKYWNLLREDHEHLPLYAKFDRSQIDDLLGFCCEISIEKSSDKKTYVFKKVGEQIKQVYGNVEGLPMNNNLGRIPGGKMLKSINEYRDKHDYDKPLVASGTFVNFENKIVKYRSCALFFCDNNGDPSNIVLGVSWRIF